MFVQWFSLKNWLKTNVISFSCEGEGGVMGNGCGFRCPGGGVLPDKSDGGARRALRSLNLWIGTA